MKTPFIHQLEELVIVAIVYVYPDEYGTRSVEGLLKHSLDLVRRLNHETMGSERLRILYGINRAERVVIGKELREFSTQNMRKCSESVSDRAVSRHQQFRDLPFAIGSEPKF